MTIQNENKSDALLAILGGAIGLHRFRLGQPKVGVFYLAAFFIAPVIAIGYAIVDAVFLLITPRQEWLRQSPATWKTSTRRRICLYGTLALLYLGIPLFPFIPAMNYSLSEGPPFYSSYTLPKDKLPIFYRDEYNIQFFGLEKLHPFDSQKYGRVFNTLTSSNSIRSEQIVEPPMISDEMLEKVHPQAYLESLKKPFELLKILEIPVVYFVPWQFTHRQVLSPMRYATSGTILAARAAWERGRAINLGGGFHHAHANEGGGFCAYADITLAIRNLRESLDRPVKVMILDLDAHQGNGHEHDFLGDHNTFILDAYNPSIYPGDKKAKEAIGLPVDMRVGISDEEYLEFLQKALRESESRFTPEFILYNAGTDIMDGDPLGLMRVSARGVQNRDEMVFDWAFKKKIPIAMVLSGEYQQSNAPAIAGSISNLLRGPINQIAISKLPKDVQEVLERKSCCGHWSGEDPYDQDRENQINKALRECRCNSFENDYRIISKKYASNREILDAMENASDDGN